MIGHSRKNRAWAILQRFIRIPHGSYRSPRRAFCASRGSQYFWLSKDAFDFFPALTIPNARGDKPTYSTEIEITYVDLDQVHTSRVTYEAGNNVDFRLGTGPLRGTRTAQVGDIAALTRRANAQYELRIIKPATEEYAALSRPMINFIGNREKRYGYLPNEQFDRVMNDHNNTAIDVR